MATLSVSPTLSVHSEALEQLYASNLLYVPDCWKLCGDAHCCGFARYKSRFRILTAKPFQALPLLPGEYDFLVQKGLTAQFGDHEHRVNDYVIDHRIVRVEELVSRVTGCCCNHASRTVVCRLYPLLPVLDAGGNLVSVDEAFGSFEELELVDGIAPACQVRTLPFNQMEVFLSMARIIGGVPQWVFAISAYRIAKAHVFSRLRAKKANTQKSAFELFESMYFTRQLFDHTELRKELVHLADEFEARYGAEMSFAVTEPGSDASVERTR
jgi:hypothetical protein